MHWGGNQGDMTCPTSPPDALASENIHLSASQATWGLYGRASQHLTTIQKVYLPTALHLPRPKGA